MEGHASEQLKEMIEVIPYDPKFDRQPVDAFAPIKTDNNTLRMPKKIKVHFIGKEEDIGMLNELVGSSMIGMDSEWRPPISPYDKQRPGLLQLSNDKTTYLIDLVALSNNKLLDEMLANVFTHTDTLCIGFSFKSDLEMFNQFFPAMTFYKKFTNFVDVQDYYMKLHELDNQIGLAKVSIEILGKEICKGEQMSNWEKRPLRLSQQHYGALDAYALIDMLKIVSE